VHLHQNYLGKNSATTAAESETFLGSDALGCIFVLFLAFLALVTRILFVLTFAVIMVDKSSAFGDNWSGYVLFVRLKHVGCLLMSGGENVVIPCAN
jgi:hypothetical protein